MELKLLTEDPHTEDDLIAKKPIIFSLGGIELSFPMFSYRDYVDFERGIKALSARSLIGQEYSSIEEFKTVLNKVYGNYPEFYLFGDLVLPRFILQFAEPINKKECVEELNKWIRKNPTKTHIWILDEDCISSDLKMGLVDYLANNFDILKCYELFMLLLNLQTKIKKKVAGILTTTEPESEASVPQPRSQDTLIMLESIRKKRLARQRMHSS